MFVFFLTGRLAYFIHRNFDLKITRKLQQLIKRKRKLQSILQRTAKFVRGW